MKFENEHAIFRPNKDGLQKLMGDLECRVMELIWTLKYPVSVKEIYQIMLKQGEDYSYTTIMTVMSRLAEKGLLQIKEVVKRANIYEATSSRDEFITKSTSIILDSLIKDFPDVVFNHFLAAGQENRIKPEKLDELKKRISEKRRLEEEETP